MRPKYFHEGAILPCGRCGTEAHELYEVEDENGDTVEVCNTCRDELGGDDT